MDLFILPTCPYCKKVIDFLEENQLQYDSLNIENEEKTEVLLKLGGKIQVPFLWDKSNNIGIYESDEIIEYLKTLL